MIEHQQLRLPIGAGRCHAGRDPRPADLEPPVLEDDVHVAAAADRAAGGHVDRRERELGAGVAARSPSRPRLGAPPVGRPGESPSPDRRVEADFGQARLRARGSAARGGRCDPRGSRVRSGGVDTGVGVGGVTADGSVGRLDAQPLPGSPSTACADGGHRVRVRRAVDAFLDEYFALDPIVATNAGDARPTTAAGRMLTEAGRGDRLAFYDRWRASWRRSATPPSTPTSGSTATSCWPARRTPIRRAPPARGCLEPAGLGLPARRRPLPAHRPGLRAAGDRLASVAERLERLPAVVDAATRGARRARRPAGRPLPHRDGARAAGRASPSSSTTRSPRRGRAEPETTGRRRGPAPAPGRARTRRDRPRRLRGPPPRRRPADVRRRGPPRARPVRREDAPHDADSDADAGLDPRAGRARVRGRPGRDGPDRPRDLRRPGCAGRAARRTTTPRPSGPSSTRSPSSTRTGDGSSTSAGPSSAGSRRSAARATSSGWPRSRSRSAGRRSSCGPSAGRC